MLSDVGIDLRLGARLRGDQMEAESSCGACWVVDARYDLIGSFGRLPSVARLESCCSDDSSYGRLSDRKSRVSLALLHHMIRSVHCLSLAPSSFFRTLGLQGGYVLQRQHSI